MATLSAMARAPMNFLAAASVGATTVSGTARIPANSRVTPSVGIAMLSPTDLE
jgi:hypothetical protein